MIPITVRRPDFLQGRPAALLDDTLFLAVDLYQHDRPFSTAPDSATIDIRRGSEDLVSGAALTQGAGPEGANNRFSYTVPAVNLDELSDDYSALLKFDFSGSQEPIRSVILFDVVKTLLASTLTERDLFEAAPGLTVENELDRVDGIADAAGGSATTLVADDLQHFPDDWFTGGRIEFLSGDDVGEWREVTGFTRSTGTVTFAPAISAAPDGDNYRITRSYEPIVRRAFLELEEKIRGRGYRPNLVVDSSQLTEPHLCLAVARAYRALWSVRMTDAYLEAAREWEDRFKAKFAATRLMYDPDEDTIADGPLEVASVRMRRR